MSCMRCFGSMASTGEFRASRHSRIDLTILLCVSSKCQMTSVAGRDEFKDTPCPLEPLIKANGGRSVGQSPMKKKPAKKRPAERKGRGKGKRALSDDEDESEADFSEEDSDEE